MTDGYVWTRRDNETDPAYQAFKLYLDMGPERSCDRVAKSLGKSLQLLTGWSSKHEWVARVRAFDRHVAEAETDGLVNAIAESRDKNLALMDKLRGLLDMRLDDFIAKRDDPTIRWTQACMAMAKIEANSLMMKDSQKTDERVEAVLKMAERIEALGQEVSA